MRKIFTSFIHPSWSIVVWMCGVIVGAIFNAVFAPTYFSHFAWFLCGIVFLSIAVFMPRGFTLILAFISGLLIVLTRAGPITDQKLYLLQFYNQKITLRGVTTKTTHLSSHETSLTITHLEIINESGTVQIPDASVYVKVRTNVEAKRSDSITLSGILSDGFGNFDASIKKPEVLDLKKGDDVLLDFRDYFAEKVSTNLPDLEAGLGLGYLLGDKSLLDDNLQEALRLVGLTHIVVASGTHLSVVVSISKRIFGKISRSLILISSLFLIVGFIGITGLSPSILRAGLVSSLSLIAWYFGRKFAPWRIILLAATITLLYNPCFITDLAWLLSFASFVGIMVISPRIIKQFYSERKPPGIIASTFISSLSASIVCLPITIYYFGSFSMLSFIANILILPTIAAAMGGVFLTGLSTIIFAPLGVLFGFVTKLLIDYQILIINSCASVSAFSFEMETSNPVVFFWYLFIALPLLAVFIVNKIRIYCYNCKHKRR